MVDASDVTIEGTVERVTFENAATGFRVVKISVERADATKMGPRVAVVGSFPPVGVGARVRVHGRRVTDERHGDQLVADSVMELVPSTTKGLERYLGAGVVKGVGPKTAERIVARFGLDALRVLDDEPWKLAQVEGLGDRRATEIAKAWRAKKGVREVMVFLQANGATPALAARIFKRYGQNASNVVVREPYRLAREVWGIGFGTADRIALARGIARDAPERVEAGVLQAMNDAVDAGHVYIAGADLAERALALLGLEPKDAALATSAVGRLVAAGHLIRENERLFRADLLAAEVRVAATLAALARATPKPLEHAEDAIARFEARTKTTLAREQRQAVQDAAKSQVLVVTGGPGVGKTTLLRALLSLFDASGVAVRLAAPTGRAAKRMTEATGHEACTLHRLLDFDPQTGGFRRGSARPIEAGAIVVDEMSMVDLPMADALLAAVPKHARLVLVGDVDQLPSVGPGAVLRDVIASGVVVCVRLVHVFRQAEQSLIVTNAHRINRGEEPVAAPEGARGADFFFVERADPAEARATVVELVSRRIPQRFGLDPLRDVQVLVPMHRGEAGAHALNDALQAALNPPSGSPTLTRGAHVLRGGDKVMQLRNDYDKEVYNGDVGVVSSVDPEGKMTVRFDGRPIDYEGADLDDLGLSYACTVHKSQGSEYPAVVLVLLTSAFVMLSRNLLYTAVTRGKRLVVIVGQRRAARIALREDRKGDRRSALAARLQQSSRER